MRRAQILPARPGALRQRPQDPQPQGVGQPQQVRPVHLRPVRRQNRVHLRPPVFLLPPQDLRRAADAPLRAGVQLLQQRHNVQPKPVPGHAGVAVGLVLNMADAVLLQIFLNFLPGGLQQGADDVPPHRRDARQALGARAPQQVQQHRLRLVGGVVGRGDAVRPGQLRRPAEGLIPQPPPGLLDANAPLFCFFRHADPLRHAGDAPLPAEILHKQLIPPGRVPLAVVHVHRRHGEILPLAQLPQIMQQAHGVPSAADGAQDAPARLRQHIPPPHKRQQIQLFIPHSGFPVC